ncbi:mitotic checkpoint regulator, MAD2B-interacting-domain-containing protein [Calycina marina]|uniref:Mitotic checkpoint regulator, MAD2B-interacting-domain-containing protein n=1 Tax=Calycina marina TaxID=1763456 RepID=A0A9P8CEA9_9HELO|nr:mitotic checkpoint regulator, MAD2B-interacting-domain-containing protein [Calycina marina]
MGLVDYSDSDGSDVEQTPITKLTNTSGKQAFRKVIDRSNPGKIRISLPAHTKDTRDEPAAKRLKTGSLSGFNSFLPAPKRAVATASTPLGGGAKKGLGSGVNLKTGAGPGFSREPEPEREGYDEYNEDSNDISVPAGGARFVLPAPKLNQDGQQPADIKPIGKATLFRPLSVSRKPAKKKKKQVTATPSSTPATPLAICQIPENPAARPKVAMFSLAPEPSATTVPTSNGNYKPIMLQEPEVEEETEESFDLSSEDYTPNTSHIAPPAVPTPPISQSLDDIAGDLNLSAAERRQLFGRGGRGTQAAPKVINFSTDQEYMHNETLRAAGETVKHNPVRAIAPGKHSLKQLVNAVQTQKDALEESFAQGKHNRSEAASRYGW